MHEIEPSSFCSLAEYRQHLELRRQAADITIDGLYLVLASLRGEVKNKEAFKFPITVKDVKVGNAHMASLTVNLLDADLRPRAVVAFDINDGIAVDPELWEQSTQQKVKEMYIKDYEDYMPGGLQEVSMGDLVSGQLELVGV